MESHQGKDLRTPLEHALSKICGKWKSRIISSLGTKGPMRYSLLREEAFGVFDTMLSKTLREMAQDDIVECLTIDRSSSRPHSEYRLTAKGWDVFVALRFLCDWA